MPVVIIVGLEVPRIGSNIAWILSEYKVPGEILLIILNMVSNCVTSSTEEFSFTGISELATSPAIKLINRKRNNHTAIEARADVAVFLNNTENSTASDIQNAP